MAESGTQDISGLLTAWSHGDAEALNRLMPFVYPEVRRIARRRLGRCPAGDTLESAAVANEVYLKMIKAGSIRCENRMHFLALCAQIIRRILVDHARSRGYAKRGGNAPRVPLDEVLVGMPAPQIDVLALHEALGSLARIDSRKSRVIELRYFGGLTLEEAAEVLGISGETAKRDWKMARAWLFAELTGKQARSRA
jgi:RNA polymerase sigma-70 factor (ECF subfamily)